MAWATEIAAYATVAQAGSTIVALYIALKAITTPDKRQRHREQAEDQRRRLEAKCLATAIRSDLHDVSVALSNVKLTAGARVARSTPDTWIPEFQSCKIERPHVIAASLNRIHVLGDPAGPSLLRLLAVLDAYNDAIDREILRGSNHPTTVPAEHWRMLVRFVDDVMPIVEATLQQVMAAGVH
jgi:hypothetical protein